MDEQPEALIELAWQSAEAGADNALELADKAVFALKSRGIP